MNKLEFINTLGEHLSLLPPQEVTGILDYYVESIDDRMEDGMNEAEAIESLGPIGALAAKILSEQERLDVPEAPEPPKAGLEPDLPIQPRRMSPGTIALLIIGSPIWLSLGAAAFSLALALYIMIWALLGSLTIIAGALILSGILGAVAVWFVPVYPNTIAVRVLFFGGCLVCAGLGFLLLPAALALICNFVRLHSMAFHKLRQRKETI